MKEIKFRSYDKNDKKIYEDFIFGSEPVNKSFKTLQKNDVVFTQYIGLKDINGKEIYGGDIVRWGMDDLELSGVRYAVIETYPTLRFRVLFYKDEKTGKKKYLNINPFYFEYSNFIYKDTEKYLEVIGNIFEDEGLLND